MNTAEKQSFMNELQKMSNDDILWAFTNFQLLPETAWELPDTTKAYFMLLDEINHRGLSLGEAQ